jgi:hypothetical protein
MTRLRLAPRLGIGVAWSTVAEGATATVGDAVLAAATGSRLGDGVLGGGLDGCVQPTSTMTIKKQAPKREMRMSSGSSRILDRGRGVIAPWGLRRSDAVPAV